jgi:ubiquinone biosynthesis accessory factor UbiJ
MLPFLLPFTPLRLAPSALNALLRREDWARERLQRHAGKTARLALGGFSLSLTIGSDGYVETSDTAIVPDVTLTVVTEKLAVLKQMFSEQSRPDMAEIMHISGDAALAQAAADLAKHLRWDAQEDLANVVGDIPAAKLVAGAQALSGGLREAGKRFAHNVAEFLSEEQNSVAGRPMFEQWRNDTASLNTVTNALQAKATDLAKRLDRLAAKRSA